MKFAHREINHFINQKLEKLPLLKNKNAKTKNKAREVINNLLEVFPNAGPELNFNNDYELLVAVILSAQCTDKRVNIITSTLFEVAPTIYDLDHLKLEEIEDIIKSCGLYKAKAEYLKEMSKIVVNEYDGQIPDRHEDLVKLPGVGRKTANVVVSIAFDEPAIAVDTHVFRVSNRVGLSTSKTVTGVEKDLMKLIPKDYWTKAHHLFILHGRYICTAKSPKCSKCSISNICDTFQKENYA